MCPLVVGEQADVNAMGGYQGQPRPFGYQNSYNSSWKQNPNYPPKQLPQNALTRPSHPQQQNPHPQHSQPQHPLNQHYQHPHQHQFQQPQNSGNPQMSLQDLVMSLATSQSEFQKETRTAISTMQTQIEEMATSINKLESRGRLPSQTVTNPRENVNMVSLMSVQEIEESWDAKTLIAHILATYNPPPPFPQRFLSPKQMKEPEEEAKVEDVPLKENVVSIDNVDPPKKSTISPLVMPPPFPS
ncbi:hypothetical protein LXL04_030624 [Taraxacum kok-saghyz]